MSSTRPTAPQQPPGWYFDPTGRHEARWWDGSGWTEHVSDHGTTTVDPLRSDDLGLKARRGGGRGLAFVAVVVLLLAAGGAAVWYFVVREDDSATVERDVAVDEIIAERAVVEPADLNPLWSATEPAGLLVLDLDECDHLDDLDGEPSSTGAVGVGDALRVEQLVVVAASSSDVDDLLTQYQTEDTRACLLAVYSASSAQRVTPPTVGDDAVSWQVQTEDGPVDVLAVRTDRVLSWFAFEGGGTAVSREIQGLAAREAVRRIQAALAQAESTEP